MQDQNELVKKELKEKIEILKKSFDNKRELKSLEGELKSLISSISDEQIKNWLSRQLKLKFHPDKQLDEDKPIFTEVCQMIDNIMGKKNSSDFKTVVDEKLTQEFINAVNINSEHDVKIIINRTNKEKIKLDLFRDYGFNKRFWDNLLNLSISDDEVKQFTITNIFDQIENMPSATGMTGGFSSLFNMVLNNPSYFENLRDKNGVTIFMHAVKYREFFNWYNANNNYFPPSEISKIFLQRDNYGKNMLLYSYEDLPSDANENVIAQCAVAFNMTRYNANEQKVILDRLDEVIRKNKEQKVVEDPYIEFKKSVENSNKITETLVKGISSWSFRIFPTLLKEIIFKMSYDNLKKQKAERVCLIYEENMYWHAVENNDALLIRTIAKTTENDPLSYINENRDKLIQMAIDRAIDNPKVKGDAVISLLQPYEGSYLKYAVEKHNVNLIKFIVSYYSVESNINKFDISTSIMNKFDISASIKAANILNKPELVELIQNEIKLNISKFIEKKDYSALYQFMEIIPCDLSVNVLKELLINVTENKRNSFLTILERRPIDKQLLIEAVNTDNLEFAYFLKSKLKPSALKEAVELAKKDNKHEMLKVLVDRGLFSYLIKSPFIFAANTLRTILCIPAKIYAEARNSILNKRFWFCGEGQSQKFRKKSILLLLPATAYLIINFISFILSKPFKATIRYLTDIYLENKKSKDNLNNTKDLNSLEKGIASFNIWMNWEFGTFSKRDDPNYIPNSIFLSDVVKTIGLNQLNKVRNASEPEISFSNSR